MKYRSLMILAMVLALAAFAAAARAEALQRVWMEYEDYSGNRAEQIVDDPALMAELEQMLLRARDNPAELDGCTLNTTLFCMWKGNIYDFACATDGCPFIQNRSDGRVYTLGVDYQRFWEIFAEVRQGMGFDASAVADW